MQMLVVFIVISLSFVTIIYIMNINVQTVLFWVKILSSSFIIENC